MARLERATLCTQNRCATRLRYIPKRKPRNTRFSAVTGIHAKWGERRDLNSRPSGPQPDALPTELLPPYKRGTYWTFSCLASLFLQNSRVFSSLPRKACPVLFRQVRPDNFNHSGVWLFRKVCAIHSRILVFLPDGMRSSPPRAYHRYASYSPYQGRVWTNYLLKAGIRFMASSLSTDPKMRPCPSCSLPYCLKTGRSSAMCRTCATSAPPSSCWNCLAAIAKWRTMWCI